tara:strand:- start:75 stop:344 length:270 start_codon:yes stop_codon:yes gene_type:complete
MAGPERVPKVVLPSGLSRQFTGGETEIEVEGQTVRDLVRALEARFPGLGPVIELGMAVAIDGEIYQDAFLEPVEETSEVCILPAIRDGS